MEAQQIKASDTMVTHTQEITAVPQHQPQQLNTGLSLFDQGTFTQVQAIAKMMAQSSLVPESLRSDKNGAFDLAVVEANCFRVVNQSMRWNLDPFSILDCCSMVHGKMQYEGKLVHAILQSLAGINLEYSYSGQGLDMKVVASGTLPGEDKPRTVEGTVKDWKTNQWPQGEFQTRLTYRAARTWARVHNPAVLLGIVTDDEELPKNEKPPMRTVGSQSAERPNPFKKEEPKPEAIEVPAEEKTEPKPEEKPAKGKIETGTLIGVVSAYAQEQKGDFLVHKALINDTKIATADQDLGQALESQQGNRIKAKLNKQPTASGNYEIFDFEPVADKPQQEDLI